MEIPSIEEMLKAGVHIGHKTSRWNPKMEPFISQVKNRIHIINLEKTREMLEKACQFVKELAAGGGVILFVGTKDQIRNVTEEWAKKTGMPYVSKRWIGGLLTNFDNVKKNIKKLEELEAKKETAEWQKLLKKEKQRMEKEIKKLTDVFEGIKTLKKIPDALFIIDIVKEKTALFEAKRMNLPIVAIIDTNADPSAVTYPIPGNDDATKSVNLIMQCIAEAIIEGQNQVIEVKKEE